MVLFGRENIGALGRHVCFRKDQIVGDSPRSSLNAVSGCRGQQSCAFRPVATVERAAEIFACGAAPPNSDIVEGVESFDAETTVRDQSLTTPWITASVRIAIDPATRPVLPTLSIRWPVLGSGYLNTVFFALARVDCRCSMMRAKLFFPN